MEGKEDQVELQKNLLRMKENLSDIFYAVLNSRMLTDNSVKVGMQSWAKKEASLFLLLCLRAQ